LNSNLDEKYQSLVGRINLKIVREYDENALNRIAELYKLRDFLHLNLNSYIEKESPPDRKDYLIDSIHASMMHHVDLLLYNFMNDESLVVLDNRGTIPLTLSMCMIRLNEDRYDFPVHDATIKTMEDLYINRNDEMIGSMFLDFASSIFSSFEVNMRKVYVGRVSKKQQKENDFRYKKFIPANVVIQDVLSLVRKNGALGEDVLADYKYCIKVCREIRNTIHTLGFYSNSNELEYEIDNCKIYLRPQKPVYADDFGFYMKLCKKIVLIYLEICKVLDVKVIGFKEYVNG
jgi:hypothetical protein